MGSTYEGDDTLHEMTIRGEFEDGAVSGGGPTVRDGVTMILLDDHETWRPAGENVAWRIVCFCQTYVGRSIHAQRDEKWVSPTRWVRISPPAPGSTSDLSSSRVRLAEERPHAAARGSFVRWRPGFRVGSVVP